MEFFASVYKNAFYQCRDHWKTMLPWSLLYIFVSIIYIFPLSSKILETLFAKTAGVGSLLGMNIILIILSVAVSILLPIIGTTAALRTAHDESPTQQEILVYSFERPIRLLLFWLLTFAAGMLLSGIAFLGSKALSVCFGVLTIAAAILLVCVMTYFGVRLSFIMAFGLFSLADNEDTGAGSAFLTGVNMTKRIGNMFSLILLTIPIFAAIMLSSYGLIKISSSLHEEKFDEYVLALQGIQVNADSEALQTLKKMDPNALKNREAVMQWLGSSVYSEPVPEYDGSTSDYMRAMAEYAAKWHVFEAQRVQHDPPSMVQNYLYGNYRIKHINYLYIILLSALLTLLSMYFMAVLAQIYDHRNGRTVMLQDFDNKAPEAPNSRDLPSDKNDISVSRPDAVSFDMPSLSLNSDGHSPASSGNDSGHSGGAESADMSSSSCIDPGFDLKF